MNITLVDQNSAPGCPSKNVLAQHRALGEGPSTPASPQALPKFEVRKV